MDSSPARGAFVVFEGGEGAGKTTQIALLADRLRNDGHQVVVTREPGGTPLAEQVRQLLLTVRDTDDDIDDAAEAMLYAAARAQHLARVIRPALEAGTVVLCDRFVDSSLVYQGVARGLGIDRVADLNRWAVGDTLPDLTVVLDIQASDGLRRAGNQPDRLESAGLAFHEQVNAAYRSLATRSPDSHLLVDATLPVDVIADAILRRAAATVPGAAANAVG